MFIKIKFGAGGAYANRMFVSFKMPDNFVRCEAAFVGHNSIF